MCYIEENMQEVFNDMLFEEELEKVYKEHFDKCQEHNYCEQKQLADEAEQSYQYSRAAKVGCEYKKQDVQVLIIGQEQPKVREENFSPPSTTATNQHWKRTLLTIAKCLGKDYSDLEKLENSKDMTELYEYAKKFAFTNIYKCGFSKDGKWSGSSVKHNTFMAKNCSQLFLKEIEILKPDLIIKQGKWNSDCIEGIFEKNGKGTQIKFENQNMNISLYKYENYYFDKPLYVIYAYHPTCKNPNWYKHRKSLYNCIEKFNGSR